MGSEMCIRDRSTRQATTPPTNLMDELALASPPHSLHFNLPAPVLPYFLSCCGGSDFPEAGFVQKTKKARTSPPSSSTSLPPAASIDFSTLGPPVLLPMAPALIHAHNNLWIRQRLRNFDRQFLGAALTNELETACKELSAGAQSTQLVVGLCLHPLVPATVVQNLQDSSLIDSLHPSSLPMAVTSLLQSWVALRTPGNRSRTSFPLATAIADALAKIALPDLASVHDPLPPAAWSLISSFYTELLHVFTHASVHLPRSNVALASPPILPSFLSSATLLNWLSSFYSLAFPPFAIPISIFSSDSFPSLFDPELPLASLPACDARCLLADFLLPPLIALLAVHSRLSASLLQHPLSTAFLPPSHISNFQAFLAAKRTTQAGPTTDDATLASYRALQDLGILSADRLLINLDLPYLRIEELKCQLLTSTLGSFHLPSPCLPFSIEISLAFPGLVDLPLGHTDFDAERTSQLLAKLQHWITTQTSALVNALDAFDNEDEASSCPHLSISTTDELAAASPLSCIMGVVVILSSLWIHPTALAKDFLPELIQLIARISSCLLYTSPSPRDS